MDDIELYSEAGEMQGLFRVYVTRQACEDVCQPVWGGNLVARGHYDRPLEAGRYWMHSDYLNLPILIDGDPCETNVSRRLTFVGDGELPLGLRK